MPSIRFLLVVLSLSFSGCLSYTTSPSAEIEDLPRGFRKLPYHVAIVPLEVANVRSIPRGSKKPEMSFRELSSETGFGESEDLEQWVAEGPAAVTETLRDILAEDIFERVTLLQVPDKRVYKHVGRDRSEAYWTLAANDINADLLLYVESFEYPRHVSSRARPQNFGLFFLWPLSVLRPDRTYLAKGMSLDLAFYGIRDLPSFPGLSAKAFVDEVHLPRKDALQKEAASFRFAEGGNEVRSFRLRPREIPLRFGDRLGKGPLSLAFWGSLFLPSSLQQKDNPKAAELLKVLLPLALCKKFGSDLANGDAYYLGRRRHPKQTFYFDAESARVFKSRLRSEDTLEIVAPFESARSTDFYPGVPIEIGGYEFPLRVYGGERPEKSELVALLDNSRAVAELRPMEDDPLSGRSEIHIYVPLQANRAKALGVPRTTRDVQLRIVERISEDENVTQSWTFDITDLVDKAVERELFSEKGDGSK